MLKNNKMQVDKKISIGNIVSWSLIALAFIVSYGRLQGNVSSAQAEAREARLTATAATKQANQVAVDATAQVNELRISLARVEERLKSIDVKVDDIKKATTKP